MRTLNGQSLKQLLISGSNNLYNHYPEVDALNVFPVPDGDTGMNMNLTLTSGSKEIQNRSDESAYEISKVFSRGLLMGASSAYLLLHFGENRSSMVLNRVEPEPVL